MYDVVVLPGSLRRRSMSRRLAWALAAIAPKPLALDILELEPLAMYNEDLERVLPPPWRGFRARIRRADAVLLITPEYGRSIPGVLANALDVGSHPCNDHAWSGKPCAVISHSPDQLGGFGANHQVRESLVFLNMPILPQPQVYLANSATLLDAQNVFRCAETRAHLDSFLDAFAHWIGDVTRADRTIDLRRSASDRNASLASAEGGAGASTLTMGRMDDSVIRSDAAHVVDPVAYGGLVGPGSGRATLLLP